jgi:Ser/Thr protein kinase RdoA (MazF antagonist)
MSSIAFRARGYPVPEPLCWGPIDERWFALVQTRLPGEPLASHDSPTLDRLLTLVDLQAEPELGSGGWDVSWWIGVVLFEGWEHWWEAAESAAPKTARRLRSFLEPAWGHRLQVRDVVHGDLNVSNVLARDGEITGVVDLDHLGLGSRAVDLTSLLFDWQPGGGSQAKVRRCPTAASASSAASWISPARTACVARWPTPRSPGSR